MKTLFLGDFGARVSSPVLAKATEIFDTTVLGDLGDTQRLIPALAEAEIVVGHIWKKDFPEAPRLKLLQSPAAGLDLIDLPSLPRGVAVCNVTGHEQPIAEYVLMTMLALSHQLLDIAAAFRAGSWAAARRSARQDDRNCRLWPHRPRGRQARRRDRQSQPDRRSRRRGGDLSAR